MMLIAYLIGIFLALVMRMAIAPAPIPLVILTIAFVFGLVVMGISVMRTPNPCSHPIGI